MRSLKIVSKDAGVGFPINQASWRNPLPFQFRGQSSHNRPGASEMSWLERGEGDGLSIKCTKSSQRKQIVIIYCFKTTHLVLVVNLDGYWTQNPGRRGFLLSELLATHQKCCHIRKKGKVQNAKYECFWKKDLKYRGFSLHSQNILYVSTKDPNHLSCDLSYIYF